MQKGERSVGISGSCSLKLSPTKPNPVRRLRRRARPALVMAISEVNTTSMQPNKHVQSDAAPRSGIGAKIGYVMHFELKRTSGKSRRG